MMEQILEKQSLTILIIDDSVDDRENYIRLLKKALETNFRCHETTEGKAGLAAIDEFHPDCILLDYSLPGANGLEVLKWIKGQHDIPTIMLTGQGNESIAVQAIKMGANDYLSKSAMTVETLCHSIRIAMEHHYLQNKIDEQTKLLFKNELRYQQLIDGVKDHAFCWLDKDGRVEVWNSGAERLMGYTETEASAQPIAIFYTDEDRHNGLPQTALDQALAHGKFTHEGWHVRKDGSRFWANVQIDALHHANGQLLGFVKITRDFTERRDAELQRQQLIETLMRSNTELERFAYVASHDMQEPVRMVINFSSILAKDYSDKLDDEGRAYLKFVTESANRIHDMIDDLLDYARFGHEGDGMTQVDAASELGHVLHNLEALINENGAKITYDALPVFQGNPVQFMRLMQNLIANAIKYRAPQRAPAVHIGSEDAGDAWHLSVTDNGMGVDEVFTQKIFEPFRRLHTWDKIKGTGLGLAVCKKIVENHGGQIWMTSKLGQGSTFFISFPKQCSDQKMIA